MEKGFGYLVAIMDRHSRKVLSWRLSNTLDADFCVRILEAAIQDHGCPKIMNSDQGVQFTSEAFTSILKTNGIQISMDDKGCYYDNIRDLCKNPVVEKLILYNQYQKTSSEGFYKNLYFC
ncbi:putative transposase [Nitrosomonas cryotolerans]|nr:putative transposase [Nitrosomonas cryotolerans]